jgi:hypothetical protein
LLASNVYAGLQPVEQRMILIAGADARATDEAAVALFEAGHVPMMSEWLAFPLIAIARPDPASRQDPADTYVHPIAERLLGRCDAVLRAEGDSHAADAVVAAARARGLRVYFSVQDAIDG